MEQMKPGRELDTLMAEKVMEWKLLDKSQNLWAAPASDSAFADKFCPSTDIAAAWEVVAKIEQLGFMIDIQTCDNFHQVQIEKMQGLPAGGASWETVVESTNGETTPHAICLAAAKLFESK